MRMVSVAGFDLRLVLEPREDHDEVLESLERQRPREEQERWRKLQEGIAQSRPNASGRFVTVPDPDDFDAASNLNRHASARRDRCPRG